MGYVCININLKIMKYSLNKLQITVVLKEDQSLTIKVVSQDAIEITKEERQFKDKETTMWWKILKWFAEEILKEACLYLYNAINEDRGDEIAHTVKMVFDKVMDALFDWDFIIIGWCVFIYIFVLHIVIRNTCSVNSFLGHSERRKSSTCKK